MLVNQGFGGIIENFILLFRGADKAVSAERNLEFHSFLMLFYPGVWYNTKDFTDEQMRCCSWNSLNG